MDHRWATVFMLVSSHGQINVYPSDLDPSPVNLNASCIAAINATIGCDPSIVPYASQDFYGSFNNATMQDSICADSCETALVAYRKEVLAVCGVSTEMQVGYPTTYAGDLIWNYYNLTCLTDSSTGEYCTDYIDTVNASIAGADISIATLDSTVLCSPCMIQLFQNRQGTSFSGYSTSSATTWADIQAIYNVSYPTDVQPPAATPTSVYGFANTTYSGSCLSGNTYTVASGDTCTAISHANGVATGTLITINQILPGCTDIQVGQTLCLPRPCTTVTVASGQTCASIASAAGTSLLSLLSWNPSLNAACTNLLAGYDVCVSIPGGAAWTGTTIAGVTPTATAVYATTVVAPAGPTAAGTTADCGRYYEVVTGDYCQKVALNNTISMPLFVAINPSVDAACDNLVPGLYYCTFPTADWNDTSSSGSGGSSTTVPAPAPTSTETTTSCYEWYVVQSGDYCYLIEQSYSVTLEQLMQWNPALDAACDNLLVGDAYCVSGPSASATVTTSSVPTTVAAPAPTLSGTTATCYEWHTVVSGDYCYLLETDYNINFAQLQTWNTGIDDACDNLEIGEAYHVTPGARTTRQPN